MLAHPEVVAAAVLAGWFARALYDHARGKKNRRRKRRLIIVREVNGNGDDEEE